jgi:hypothetical protein
VEHEYLGVHTRFRVDGRSSLAPGRRPDRPAARVRDRRSLRLSHALAGLIMLEPSRKHGHYDTRWPAWLIRSSSTTADGVTANRPPAVEGVQRLQPAGATAVGGAVDAWEGEGGSVDFGPRHENGRVNRLERGSVVEGLSWEMFCETFYRDEKRHYFPAISAWSRYRDGDRSRPEGARQRAPAPGSRAGEEPALRVANGAVDSPLLALVDLGRLS